MSHIGKLLTESANKYHAHCNKNGFEIISNPENKTRFYLFFHNLDALCFIALYHLTQVYANDQVRAKRIAGWPGLSRT